MEEESFPETLVPYKNTRSQNPEGDNQNTRRHDNLKTYSTFFHV